MSNKLRSVGQRAVEGMAKRLRQIDRAQLRVASGIPPEYDQIRLIEALKHLSPGMSQAEAINRAWMAEVQLEQLYKESTKTDAGQRILA